MARSASIAPACAEANANHAFRPHATQRRSRDAIGQHAVNVRASVDLDRQEHSGIGAAGSNRINQPSLGKYDGFPCAEVGRRNTQWSRELLEGVFLQRAGKQPDHAVAVAQPVTRKRPAGKVAEAQGPSHVLQLRRSHACAVQGSNDRAHACAGHVVNRNIFLFEYLQNANVGDAAGKTSTQRHAQTYAARWWCQQFFRSTRQLAGKRTHRSYDAIDAIQVVQALTSYPTAVFRPSVTDSWMPFLEAMMRQFCRPKQYHSNYLVTLRLNTDSCPE